MKLRSRMGALMPVVLACSIDLACAASPNAKNKPARRFAWLEWLTRKVKQFQWDPCAQEVLMPWHGKLDTPLTCEMRMRGLFKKAAEDEGAATAAGAAEEEGEEAGGKAAAATTMENFNLLLFQRLTMVAEGADEGELQGEELSGAWGQDMSGQATGAQIAEKVAAGLTGASTASVQEPSPATDRPGVEELSGEVNSSVASEMVAAAAEGTELASDDEQEPAPHAEVGGDESTVATRAAMDTGGGGGGGDMNERVPPRAGDEQSLLGMSVEKMAAGEDDDGGARNGCIIRTYVEMMLLPTGNKYDFVDEIDDGSWWRDDGGYAMEDDNDDDNHDEEAWDDKDGDGLKPSPDDMRGTPVKGRPPSEGSVAELALETIAVGLTVACIVAGVWGCAVYPRLERARRERRRRRARLRRIRR